MWHAFPLMSEAGRRGAAAELAAVQEVRAPGGALVHADLGGANLLLTFASGPTGGRAPVVAGILDWDDACIGNQANDLASLAVTFGWPLTDRSNSGDVASLDDGLMQYR